IDALRRQIAEASAAADKPKYQGKLRLAMHDAEQALDRIVDWPRAEEEFDEIAKDPTAKAALGAEFDAAAKKFATFKRLYAKKASAQIEAQLDTALKDAEEQWAKSKTSSKDEAIERTEDNIAKIRKLLARLPADD